MGGEAFVDDGGGAGGAGIGADGGEEADEVLAAEVWGDGFPAGEGEGFAGEGLGEDGGQGELGVDGQEHGLSPVLGAIAAGFGGFAARDFVHDDAAERFRKGEEVLAQGAVLTEEAVEFGREGGFSGGEVGGELDGDGVSGAEVAGFALLLVDEEDVAASAGPEEGAADGDLIDEADDAEAVALGPGGGGVKGDAEEEGGGVGLDSLKARLEEDGAVGSWFAGLGGGCGCHAVNSSQRTVSWCEDFNPMKVCVSLLVLVLAAPAVMTAQKPKLTLSADADAQPLALEDRVKALDRIFAEQWEDGLRHSPEFASTLGDKRWNDQITDYSVAAYNQGLAREQEFLLKLAAVDTTGMDEQRVLSRELLMRQITEDMEAADYKEWEMPVNQMGGIHTSFLELARQLSFTTVKDYDDWIARLRQVPKAFDQVTDNMTLGIEDHRVLPKGLAQLTLEQVKALAAVKPEESPLAAPLKSFPAGIPAAEQTRIHDELLAVIAKKVLPAYQRFARFLEASYVPAARETVGAWALPDGDKYYQFCIERETTTKLTAAQLHEIGLAEVARDEAAMLEIAKKQGFADLKSFQAAVKANPKLRPASAEALMAVYRGHEADMQAKLPQLFGKLPVEKLEVVAIPDYRAKAAAAAYYEQGTVDGVRPGRITVNLYNATERNLADVEAVSYHEGVPGHHLQISLGQEMTGMPEFRKHAGYTAFVEGWALYSERLGKEVGFYQDPYSDYGRLENDIWRAIRLVVDTGVHSQHWTREQMVAYFHDHSAIDETNIQSETDRYIGWPGQALAYKAGQLKIVELREKAKAALGAKFDIRAFHDEVLDSGALPLDVLEARVNAWIAGQGGK